MDLEQMVAGTYHIRLTFLPAEDELEKALDRFGEHHRAFVAEFSKGGVHVHD
jgi:hypothetical protein